MATRKRKPLPQPKAGDFPQWVRDAPVVQDWCPGWESLDPGDAMVAARGAHRREVTRWATETGREIRQVPGTRRPRWR